MKKIAVVFAVSLLIYLLPELFFKNAMLYLTGGVIGGTINDVLKGVTGRPSDYLIEAVWFFLLVGSIFLYMRVKSKPVKFVVIVIIALLLYVVDYILGEALNFDSENPRRLLLMESFFNSLTILLKSAALTWIYCKWGMKSEIKAMQ